MEQKSEHTERFDAIREKLANGNSHVRHCIDSYDDDSFSWIVGLSDRQRAEMISFFDKVATGMCLIASHAPTENRQATTIGISALASEIKSLLDV